MRHLLVVAATVALLGAAALVSSVRPDVPDRHDDPASAATVAHRRPAPDRPFRVLPAPEGGCVVPVSTQLRGCAPPHRDRPLRSCVLPVAGLQLEAPLCPRADRMPQGRVVPLQSATDE